MEAWENKIISDKIESLHGLPEGYVPNLAAKWDIISNNWTNRKNISVTVIFTIAIAASILLAIPFVWNYLTHSENRNTVITKIQIPKQLKQNPTVVKIPEINTSEKGVSLERKRKPIKRTFQPNSLKVGIPFESTLSMQYDIFPVNTDSTIHRKLTLNPDTELKKQKRTVFQKDFDGLSTTLDTVKQKTAAETFKIRINVFKNQSGFSSHPQLFRIRENL